MMVYPSGMIAINKPAMMISKDVSRNLKRAFGKLKMGHVGTLDPLATGVLPILLGKATKFQDPLLDLPKRYRFKIRFGLLTDTLDICGQNLEQQDNVSVDLARMSDIGKTFLGEITQIPPLYSAVKHKGKPLYYYARKGVHVPLEEKARKVQVFDLRILGGGSDWAEVEVTCSRGTYVRVLAKDMAAQLGYHGTVIELERTQAAGISIENAAPWETIEKLLQNEQDISQYIIPIEKFPDGPRMTRHAGWRN
ncbi:MAG: tRNA pseudouridine(55) synthase TruB [Deltaproteobacteria bacterium]|nr:tRNA pseudouridine(55) synthase TruB [Deltaproteobacteria bacterium]